MRGYDHRRFATADDPLRQSDLKALTGEWACAKRWHERKIEQVTGVELVQQKTLRGRSVLGTAIHAVIERVLRRWPATAEIPALSRSHFERAFAEEWGRAKAPEGLPLPVEWTSSQSPEREKKAGVDMICALFGGAVQKVVARAIAIEAPFLVELEDYAAGGTIDLVYEPVAHPGGLGLLDWKTGVRLMHPIEREHGYQFGLYSRALEAGVLFPGTDEELRLERFPDEIFVAHLRDLLPYQKRTTKIVKDRDEAAFWGVEPGTRVEISPPAEARTEPAKRRRIPTVALVGHQRGPCFYPCPRPAEAVARFEHGLRPTVSMVRLGIFPESIGEQCSRCGIRTKCFADGYGPKGEEAKRIKSMISDGIFDGYESEEAA